jgi:hypothetical protein
MSFLKKTDYKLFDARYVCEHGQFLDGHLSRLKIRGKVLATVRSGQMASEIFDRLLKPMESWNDFVRPLDNMI